jgi:hypothetical protein
VQFPLRPPRQQRLEKLKRPERPKRLFQQEPFRLLWPLKLETKTGNNVLTGPGFFNSS